jgi:hypothetical protein
MREQPSPYDGLSGSHCQHVDVNVKKLTKVWLSQRELSAFPRGNLKSVMHLVRPHESFEIGLDEQVTRAAEVLRCLPVPPLIDQDAT